MLQDLLLLMVPFLFHHPHPHTPPHTNIYTQMRDYKSKSHIYEETRNLSFWVWLASLNTTISSCIHFLADVTTSFFCTAAWNSITFLEHPPHIISAPYIPSATISICYRDHLVQVSYPGKIQRPPRKWSPTHWRVLWQTRCFPALFQRVTRQSLIWGVSGFENWLQLTFSVQSMTVSLIFYFMFKDKHLP